MYRCLEQLEGLGWGEEQQEEKQVAEGAGQVREEIGRAENSIPPEAVDTKALFHRGRSSCFSGCGKRRGHVDFKPLSSLFSTCQINF